MQSDSIQPYPPRRNLVFPEDPPWPADPRKPTKKPSVFDPFVHVLDGEQHGDEYRETLIGMTLQWNVLCVVYTERQGDIFRLISARLATSIERHSYEEQ